MIRTLRTIAPFAALAWIVVAPAVAAPMLTEWRVLARSGVGRVAISTDDSSPYDTVRVSALPARLATGTRLRCLPGAYLVLQPNSLPRPIRFAASDGEVRLRDLADSSSTVGRRRAWFALHFGAAAIVTRPSPELACWPGKTDTLCCSTAALLLPVDDSGYAEIDLVAIRPGNAPRDSVHVQTRMVAGRIDGEEFREGLRLLQSLGAARAIRAHVLLEQAPADFEFVLAPARVESALERQCVSLPGESDAALQRRRLECYVAARQPYGAVRVIEVMAAHEMSAELFGLARSALANLGCP